MRSFKSMVIGAVALLAGAALAQDRMAPSLKPTTMSPPVAARLPANPTPPATTAVLTKMDVDVWLDGYIPYALRSAGIPGAVVTIVKDGQILTTRGFGYANLEKKTPVNADRTLFREGSVSKLFTWTAVMQLVEQGKIDLDGDVNKYLDFKIPPLKGKPVTMRQILTHTAGFEEAANGIIVEDKKDFLSLETYMKRWTPRRIFAPGTTPAYSNWATSLAGYIIQRVSGQDFDTYIDQHIFAPLDMRNATFRQPLPTRLAGQMATGYPTPGKPKPFEFVIPAPAGSLSASGTDMGHFMIAHLQHGQYDGHSILRPETADLMHNSPLNKVDPLSLMPPLNRMELGFFETNLNGREIIGHLGDTNAFHTSLHLFMNDHVGLFISFNGAGKGGAVGALRTAVFEDFTDRYLPNVARPVGKVDAKTAAEHARMMTGRWISSRRPDSSFLSLFYWLMAEDTVSVGPKGELLTPDVKDASGEPRKWVEVAPFVWHDVYGHDRLAAKVVDGKVVRWTIDLAAPFMIFERVPFAYSAAWLLPAICLSLSILLLTILYWPIAYAVRRHHNASAAVTGRALKAQRATRIMAGLVVVLMLGWIAAIASLSSGHGGGTALLWLLQIAGIIIFFGAVLMSAWNLYLAWTDGRRWPRKLAALLVFLATLLMLYVALAFNLVALTVNY